MPPRGTPVYEPWPLFTWMSTPLYKQDHQAANQENMFYCGRTIWPDDQWWIENYERLGLEHTYWVIATERKGAQCADCKARAKVHLKLEYEPDRGFYELKSPTEEDVQVVSIDGLMRIAELLQHEQVES